MVRKGEALSETGRGGTVELGIENDDEDENDLSIP
jgi:hypothetical protein